MKRLENSGSELIILASVTPHKRLKYISKNVHVPVLSIYDAVTKTCISGKFKSLLVLGTSPTMSSQVFLDEMEDKGIDAFYPKANDLKTKVVKIIERLYANNIAGSDDEIEYVVNECGISADSRNVAVCLGCTELPLAFGKFKSNSVFICNGINYINTIAVHVEMAFLECIKNEC